MVSRPHISDQLLTPAEQAVAELLTQGLSNAEIAAARDCSVRTVANQTRAVFAKLGVSGRREVMRALVGG